MKRHPRKTTSPYLVIRNSRIHGRGGFARTGIPKGARVIEYVGEKVTKAESSRRADVPLARHQKNKSHGAVYIFDLNKRLDLDGDVAYNTARFVNHSCDPNCEALNIGGRIWIVALRDIARGEEITYNYGYDIEDYEEFPCLCGRARCVGYILDEEHWEKMKHRIARHPKPARAAGRSGRKRRRA